LTLPVGWWFTKQGGRARVQLRPLSPQQARMLVGISEHIAGKELHVLDHQAAAQ
jgi:hypothetical protein